MHLYHHSIQWWVFILTDTLTVFFLLKVVRYLFFLLQRFEKDEEDAVITIHLPCYHSLPSDIVNYIIRVFMGLYWWEKVVLSHSGIYLKRRWWQYVSSSPREKNMLWLSPLCDGIKWLHTAIRKPRDLCVWESHLCARTELKLALHKAQSVQLFSSRGQLSF